MMFWSERLVCLCEFCRFTVFVSIDAEYAEVAGVTRPHPVVGVAAELTYRLRSGEHETHVGVCLIHEHVVFIVFEESFDDRVEFAVF